MGNINRWNLTNEQREKFLPILKEYFNKLENMTDTDVDEILATCNDYSQFELDLFDTGISPYLLQELLKSEFGYEEHDFDRNGWQWDFWITMKRKDGKTFPSTCETMMICGCGMTFELVLRPEKF